jgi:hypothetical protein
MRELRNAYTSMVREPEKKRAQRRHGYRCDDNIRIDLRKTGCEATDWIHLAQDRDQWQTLVKPESTKFSRGQTRFTVTVLTVLTLGIRLFAIEFHATPLHDLRHSRKALIKYILYK